MNTENKQNICNFLLLTLQATNDMSNVMGLMYENREDGIETVTIVYEDKDAKVVEVAHESGAMIRDIMLALTAEGMPFKIGCSNVGKLKQCIGDMSNDAYVGIRMTNTSNGRNIEHYFPQVKRERVKSDIEYINGHPALMFNVELNGDTWKHLIDSNLLFDLSDHYPEERTGHTVKKSWTSSERSGDGK